MELTFLGTAAANAYPEAFCSCENCKRSRALGGSSLRKRSSALIDDELLIDLGPDVMVAAQLHQRPLTRVRWCLQTHPHADHLDVSHFLSRSPEFGVAGAPKLHWYASAETARWAAAAFEHCDTDDLLAPATGDRLNMAVHVVAPFEPLSVGGYQVTPLPASHHSAAGCLLWAVEAGEQALLYGTDTGALGDDVWEALHRASLRFGLLVLDHTFGPHEAGSDEHLNARQLVEHVERFRREGLLVPGGRAYATHIAHEGNPPHPDLAGYAARHGYEIAYDGLSVIV